MYSAKPEQRHDPVFDASGRIRYLRDPKQSAKSLEIAKYTCEGNNAHFSFTANGTEHMFTEAHHLIPISEGQQFGYSIDVPANICSLCPNCHRCIHLGTNEEKEQLLFKLYNERNNRLEAAGIFVTFEQIKRFYNVK